MLRRSTDMVAACAAAVLRSVLMGKGLEALQGRRECGPGAG